MALLTRNRQALSNVLGNKSGALKWIGTESMSGRRNNVSRFLNKTAHGAGHNIPSAIILPQQPGGLAALWDTGSTLTPTANLTPAIPMTASDNLSLTGTATAETIVALQASGALSLAGTADLSAGVEASASASLTLTGSALLGGIIPITASASGTLTPSVTMSALANMTASAGGPTPLSPEGLAIAVWSEDLSGYNTASTAGKILKDASSAGNPWSADLATNNTPGTFGNFVQKLLTVAKFLGLK